MTLIDQHPVVPPGLRDEDRDLLMRLLTLPTVSPLEARPGDAPPRLWEAQRAYADAAAEIGFAVIRHASPVPADVDDLVPEVARRAAEADPEFLRGQPSMVLRLGPALPRAVTVMCNVHLDTVAGLPKIKINGGRVYGRGAIDAKGPAVSLLAGVRAAAAAEPAIGRTVGVLIQAVSGEEGGALGTLGTRLLVRDGHVGRLNLFCEPTGLRLLPRATASATALIRTDGEDSVDDRPERGHNATVLLGHLAAHLAGTIAHPGDGAVCVAGLHTGHLHNRVYGTGRLLLNLTYPDAAAGRRLEELTERAFADGLGAFTAAFRDVPAMRRTARDAARIARLEWVKRGLPALSAVDSPWARTLAADAGVDWWPPDEPAFTCDAIWTAGVPGAYTAVFGPGDLAGNRAHADGEFAELRDLDEHARAVARLLVAFARRTREEEL
ncbi:M20/M25/M40 family metallo-hydrolase [Catenuloplanes japonicus]|uniref:M20/M25/M40 family metallo-hydrolase n=1 Tax=Catenuloplanes japonicus TaxID=33876 RepID=UPI00068AFDC8|nr:M20/M25/M40 family metallo-hydrolase [Catenuloplanes japonicus]